MARPKVVFLSPAGMKERSEYMISLAPPDLEVIWAENRPPSAEEIPLFRDAEALIVASGEVSGDLLKHCPNVKLLQTTSAGVDWLDVKAIGEMGIPVANSGGANAITVAEQTLGLMLSVSRRMMAQWHSAVKERKWREGVEDRGFVEISNKTVGIIGLGRIGKQVAKRLKGFDTRTIYYDIVNMSQEVQQELNAQPVSLEELLAKSDIVSLHVPLTPRTRGMIGERELEKLKITACLISTCRGPVVDEKALYWALKNGHIARAGLDVLEQEPTPSDNPLFELDNVVITPHMSGESEETHLRTADFAYSNIKRVLAGEPPESVVTPDY